MTFTVKDVRGAITPQRHPCIERQALTALAQPQIQAMKAGVTTDRARQ